MGIPFGVSLFLWGERCCVPFGWSGLFRSLGAQRPVARPAPGGGPAFFGRKPEERTPGRKRFFLPGPTFSSLGGPCRGPLFFSAWPAALYPRPVTARPPAGRAGGSGGGIGRKGLWVPLPKAFPLGGRWPGAAGTDEGATGYPTGQKKEKPRTFILDPSILS